MERQDFFKAIADSYFDSQSADLESFKAMVCGVLPVFGVLKTDIIDEKDENGEIVGKQIIFIDEDKAEVVVAPEGYIPNDNDLDMSCTVMKLSVDKEGVIKIIEHGMSIFTPANKATVLFMGSLIGKKIIF